jgi:hypothetical protein
MTLQKMQPEKKKGPLVNKRPKSREETPKEGSDNAKALPHRNNMRPRCTKRKGFRIIFGAKTDNVRRRGRKVTTRHFSPLFQ